MSMLCAVNLNAQEPPEMYHITVSANPAEGGFLAFNGSIFSYGELCWVCTLTNPGWNFINWTEDGAEVSTDEFYTFIVESDRHLVANFVPTTGEINVSANPAEGGVVAGGGSYDYGTSVTVTATAHPGFLFKNWTEDGLILVEGASFSFEVHGPRNLVANFVPATVEITLSKNIENGGEVFGAGVYSYGQTVIVYLSVNLPEYMFVNWTEDGNVVTVMPAFSFPATQSRHLVANFRGAAYEIPVYANPPEGGMVTGGGVYHYGDHVTISATPNPDYHFLNWTKYVLGEGTVVSTEPDYTYVIEGEGWGNCAFVAYFAEGDGLLPIEPIDVGAMTIYPNPTDGQLTIEMGDMRYETCDIGIYDVTGKMQKVESRMQDGTLRLNFSDLPTGVYFIRIQTEKEMITRKVIKQ
jgi:hypothetical protein